MTALHVQGLVKHFDNVRAVDGLDMDVADGEFFALLGPSASGKTTTLRTICGIEQADAGNIFLDGKDMTTAQVRDRGVAMVFQTFALYPHLSIFDNLAFPLREQKLSRADIATRVGEIAEMLRLTHTLDRKPGTASGGEQQRIAIGRALVRRPKLLLLDEPLTNLDAKLRHDTRAEFKRLHREHGMTIVYATPDELEALSLGQRIGIMNEGRMVQVGTVDEVYDSPVNPFVAAQVGSPRMNLISAVRQGSDENPVIELPFADVSGGPWAHALKAFPVGAEVLFGIRPHDLSTDQSADVGPKFIGTVHLTEPLGDIVILDLVANGTQFKLVLPEEQAVRYGVGDELPLTFGLSNTHVFAKETGIAIR
ncbi:MAG: ABC transporter ATP-binding protein [Rhodospirillales bacterium]|nr:ABC transporter ATP-binding protein [Rhodospirillales bacterium]